MTNYANLKPSKPTAAANGLIVVAGSPGVGKSTFMAGCSEAIFFSCDGGLRSLSVVKIDCENWLQLKEALIELDDQTNDQGQLTRPDKTVYSPIVVIDTVDAVRQFLLEDVKKQLNKEHLTPKDYGFANDKWRDLVQWLATRPYLVVCLAHTEIKQAEDNIPARIDLAIGGKSERALAGHSDLLLLAEKYGKNYARKLTAEFPGTGKDRTGRLPALMPLEWAAFKTAWDKALAETNKGDAHQIVVQ